jgi:hypothetical protein
MILLVCSGTRIWDSSDSSSKHTRSTSKLVAAYMKLFLADGFVLNKKSSQYRDSVLGIGDVAKTRLSSFLGVHNIKSRGAQKALNSMRKLHRADHLNKHMKRYRELQAAGLILHLRTLRTPLN